MPGENDRILRSFEHDGIRILHGNSRNLEIACCFVEPATQHFDCAPQENQYGQGYGDLLQTVGAHAATSGAVGR